MRTLYLSTILAGLVSAAAAAGQDLPAPQPLPPTEPPAQTLPALKVQAPDELPVPSQMPPEQHWLAVKAMVSFRLAAIFRPISGMPVTSPPGVRKS